MKKVVFKPTPFDPCMDGELKISNRQTLNYEADGVNLADQTEVAAMRQQAEEALDAAARAAITNYWGTIEAVLEDEMGGIELYSFSNVNDSLCYYLLETPFGNARVWDVHSWQEVAGSVQHRPANSSDTSTIPDALQRAMVLGDGSKEICFADLDQDYAHGQSEAFVALKEKFEHHLEQKNWSQESRSEIQQAFLSFSEEQRNDFLNLITHAIGSKLLLMEDHPLFETGKKFPKTSKKKSTKSSATKSGSSKKSQRDPKDTRPATLEAWRAMFPDKSCQETIDQIIQGVTKGVGKDTSFNHARFKRDTGVSQKKQPKDVYEWLLACKTLYLSNVAEFRSVVITDLRPVSVFTQLTSLNICISKETDPRCLQSLTQLRNLSIDGGDAGDWLFFESLPELEGLKVWHSEPTHKSPRLFLQGCSKLKSLDWSGDFTDISFLSGLPLLEKLELSSENVSDIADLRGLAHLERLDISRCSIRDITPVFDLVTIQLLDVSNNQITSLAGIEKLNQLGGFDAEYNCISDFTPYRQLKGDTPSVRAWLEETAKTQIPVDNSTGEALYKNWSDLKKWKAHADYLETRGHPIATQIKRRLENHHSSLPWTWARDGAIEREMWK